MEARSRQHQWSRLQRRLLTIALILLSFAIFLVTNESLNPTVGAFSAGPDPGYTRAPGEEPDACAECHVPPGAGSGQMSITVPQTYLPGQTYQITVTHTNSDPTRRRWGFQLTALDDLNNKAGELSNLTTLTKVITGGPGGNRQYIEHTTQNGPDGTFFSQQGGASWTFNWTAPATNVGVVTFYAAGNHANGDGNTSGDYIYFTFNQSQSAASSPPQLRLEQSGPDPNQAAALDAVVLIRDPFRVLTSTPWFYPGADQNTRVMIFAANLGSGTVVVNLVDAMNNSFDVTAEDVRPVANSDFTQIIFRLPNNLATGTCTVRIKVGSQVSNAGTFRIVP